MEKEMMFTRLFNTDGSFQDGELEYHDLGVEVNGDGEEVHVYRKVFKPGLPAGILPTHVVRLITVDGFAVGDGPSMDDV
jgi:hypothetical protein